MKKGLSDFLTYFVLPWAASTLGLMALMAWRRSSTLNLLISWVVVAGVFGVFCFLAYLFYTGRLRIGVWRDFV